MVRLILIVKEFLLFLRKKPFFLLLTGLLILFAFTLCEQSPGRIPSDDDPPAADKPEVLPPGGPVINISSAADMAKIGVDKSYPMNGIYLLTEDITIENWQPIGSETKPFSGILNGNEKTITLKSFAGTAVDGKSFLGIFGYIMGASPSAKAEIKNLKLISRINGTSALADTAQAVGLVAGWAETAVIDSITLSGEFTYNSNRTLYVGGIAGIISEAGTVVSNSTGSLNMVISPGNGGPPLVTPMMMTPSYVGGIVGLFHNGAGIESCSNSGDVTADNAGKSAAGMIYAGGVTGGTLYLVTNPGKYLGYIQDSSSTGTVIGRSGNWLPSYTGGIAGIVTGWDTSTRKSTRIERCFATGTVSSEGSKTAYPYVGGIVGYNYFGALVSRCYFTGNVIGSAGTDQYVGGIAGYNSRDVPPAPPSRIEDCWSGGTVTGFNNAGGILGRGQVGARLSRCYSISAVSVTVSATTGIGGIVGYNGEWEGVPAVMDNCVSLNPSLTAAAGDNIHRVTGNNDGLSSNNYAWQGMTITTSGAYTQNKGANAEDGEDCVQKPDQNFYKSLGWDFTDVWTIGGDGYPKLKWQN